MIVAVENKTQTPLVVPASVRRRAGHKNGQDLEFRVSGGVIAILPKLPSADNEYTPEQRRIIDARLAEGLADIKAGRGIRPSAAVRRIVIIRPAHSSVSVSMRVGQAPGLPSRCSVGTPEGRSRTRPTEFR